MNEGFWIVVYRERTTGRHNLCYRNMSEYNDSEKQYFHTEKDAIRVRDRMQKIFKGTADYWVKYVAWGEFV